MRLLFHSNSLHNVLTEITLPYQATSVCYQSHHLSSSAAEKYTEEAKLLLCTEYDYKHYMHTSIHANITSLLSCCSILFHTVCVLFMCWSILLWGTRGMLLDRLVGQSAVRCEAIKIKISEEKNSVWAACFTAEMQTDVTCLMSLFVSKSLILTESLLTF